MPEATLVVNVNVLGDDAPRPTPASLAVQLMTTSVLCQAVSGDPQVKVGAELSTSTLTEALTLLFPATSWADPLTTVLPSASIVTDVLAVPTGDRSSDGDERR